MGVKKYQNYKLSKHFKKRAKERFGVEAEQCQKWFNSVAQKAKEYKKQVCPNVDRVAYITSDKTLFILDTNTYTAITCYKCGKADLEYILASPETNQPTSEADTTLDSTPISSSTGTLEALSDELVEFSSTSTDNADDGFYCLSDNQDTQITDPQVCKEDKFIDINNNNYATFEEEILRLERRANLKNAKEFFHVIEEDVERFYKNYQLIKNGVLSDKNYGHLQELNQDIDVIADAFRTLKKLEQNYKILDKNKQSYEQEIFEPICLSETNGFYAKQ